jgi:hypothetical protein
MLLSLQNAMNQSSAFTPVQKWHFLGCDSLSALFIKKTLSIESTLHKIT